jgi:hypothetical protein
LIHKQKSSFISLYLVANITSIEYLISQSEAREIKFAVEYMTYMKPQVGHLTTRCMMYVKPRRRVKGILFEACTVATTL